MKMVQSNAEDGDDDDDGDATHRKIGTQEKEVVWNWTKNVESKIYLGHFLRVQQRSCKRLFSSSTALLSRHHDYHHFYI